MPSVRQPGEPILRSRLPDVLKTELGHEAVSRARGRAVRSCFGPTRRRGFGHTGVGGVVPSGGAGKTPLNGLSGGSTGSQTFAELNRFPRSRPSLTVNSKSALSEKPRVGPISAADWWRTWRSTGTWSPPSTARESRHLVGASRHEVRDVGPIRKTPRAETLGVWR